MFAITIVLLVLGTLLAALGTLGFLAIWQAPSHEDVAAVRKTATAGRWMAAAGLYLYGAHHAASGPVLYALLLIVALTMATFITKSTIRPTAAGAAR